MDRQDRRSSGPPWLISRELETLHDAVIEYAVTVHRIATEIQARDPHVSYQALAILHMRAVTIHRAIRDLCELGWTPVTSALIRTLLDLYANVLAIGMAPENVRFMAFRYLMHHRLTQLHDTTINKEERAKVRIEVEAALTQAPKADVERLRNMLDDYPHRSYWYQPEFASPTTLLNQTKGEMAFIYRVFSGSVHGGVVGLGFLDDEPDEFDINHREHPRRTPLAIAMCSRLLLETTLLRDGSENTNQNAMYFHIRDKIFLPLREVLETAHKRAEQGERE